MEKDKILSGILGFCVGDALGVPVEFSNRASLIQDPVVDMRGYGTYDQPPGTWSDDTSMVLCFLDSFIEKGFLSLSDIMDKYLLWMNKSEYTPYNVMFDIGTTTRKVLQSYIEKRDDFIISETANKPYVLGCESEYDNGNGSLMRILPLAFLINSPSFAKSIVEWRTSGYADWGIAGYISFISAMTHAHPRSGIACVIYTFIADGLINGSDISVAVKSGLDRAKKHYNSDLELQHYHRLFDENFDHFVQAPQESIKSSGYVVDTLEAALWCLLTTTDYKSCVLKAVNLGGDTDTIAAVAGGLAGIHYGLNAIPKKWINQIPRLDYIEKLCTEFYYTANKL